MPKCTICFLLIFCFGLSFFGNSKPLSQTYRLDGIDSPVQDSLTIVKTIKDFLIWYKKNYIKVNSVGFTKTDKNGNYVVDVVACNKYLTLLESSTFISTNYVYEWRKYFESRKEYFVDNPQNEGPPEGFDMDLVLLTQEPELILKNIKNLRFKIKEMHKTMAIIEVTGEFKYNFELSKVKGKWKIDYIGSENYD